MVYINNLLDMNPKALETESVFLVREIKQKARYPIIEENLKEAFAGFFISDTDKEKMDQSLQAIAPTLEKIKNMVERKDSTNEAVNLGRTMQVLSEMPEALQKNIEYAEGIRAIQDYLTSELTQQLNKVPRLTTKEEKAEFNQKISKFFGILLRNEGLVFNAKDIINEAHMKHIKDLSESMTKGYFFHVTLEEELKKLNFEAIRARIPPEKLDEAEQIHNDIILIKRGVERAYDINIRGMKWAIAIYSYIKWISNR